MDEVIGPPVFQFDIVDRLTRLDEGTLEEEELVELFQYLIDTGLAWRLQGRIGRTALDLIDSGKCYRPWEKPIEVEVIYEPDPEDGQGPAFNSTYYDGEVNNG